MFFNKKRPIKKDFDREHLKPVLRGSICTGELTAGFKDIRTGKVTDVQLVRNQKELDDFMRAYDITEIEKIY